MSPRSIHWLEIRRLEEKIGRLAHIDEELIRKNKELEQQLKKIKTSYTVNIHIFLNSSPMQKLILLKYEVYFSWVCSRM